METPTHSTLKHLSREFLRRVGCCAASVEVICPIARYRVDAAGYCDGPPVLPPVGERAAATLWSLEAALAAGGESARRGPRTPRTVIIECKRSRGDFFRDGDDVESLLARRDELRARRLDLEERHIKRLEPHLRLSGSALFPELESWDFGGSRLPRYLGIRRDLRLIDRKLYGHTKFARLVKYRLADRLYVMAPSGLLRPRDLPEGWGLVECAARSLQKHGEFADWSERSELLDLPLRMTVESPSHDSPPKRRQRLLRNIAVSLTRRNERELPPNRPVQSQPPCEARGGGAHAFGQPDGVAFTCP